MLARMTLPRLPTGSRRSRSDVDHTIKAADGRYQGGYTFIEGLNCHHEEDGFLSFFFFSSMLRGCGGSVI